MPLPYATFAPPFTKTNIPEAHFSSASLHARSDDKESEIITHTVGGKEKEILGKADLLSPESGDYIPQQTAFRQALKQDNGESCP